MAYSLNRSISLPNSIGMPRWGCIRGFMEADGANAVDDSTLTVQLKDPAVAFLGCLASPWIMIQKQSLLEDIDTGSDPGREPDLDEVIGAGPFKLAEYRRGVSWDVESNPNYYDQPRPYLDKSALRVDYRPEREGGCLPHRRGLHGSHIPRLR